jgi:hypothetical protein
MSFKALCATHTLAAIVCVASASAQESTSQSGPEHAAQPQPFGAAVSFRVRF